MNEISLSSDLNVITAEINSYKQVAGQAIFEIGKRLKHVKENDLVHGEWEKYCSETLEMTPAYANRYIKVFNEFKNTNQYPGIGLKNLYEIATLPEPEREKEHTLQSGETKTVDEMTARELQEVKKQLKQKNEEIEQLKNRPVETIEKEITIERIPDDYDKIKGRYQALERNNVFYEEQNTDLREEIKQLESILKKTPKNDSSNESLQKEIEQLKKENQKKIVSNDDEDYKNKQLERLKRDSEINVYQLIVNVQSFLKEQALTDYHVGSIANVDVKTKEKLKGSVAALKAYTKDLEMALEGQIII